MEGLRLGHNFGKFRIRWQEVDMLLLDDLGRLEDICLFGQLERETGCIQNVH